MWIVTEVKIYQGTSLSKYVIKRDKDVWRLENQEKFIGNRDSLREAKDHIRKMLSSMLLANVNPRWYVSRVTNTSPIPRTDKQTIQKIYTQSVSGKKCFWHACKIDGQTRTTHSKSFDTLKEAKRYCDGN